MNTLFYLLPGIVLLHIFEEFELPGGFAAWYRAYRPERASSFTPRFFIVINALLVIGVLTPLQHAPVALRVALWLTFAALVAANGLFHIRGTIRSGRYSPGLVTGLLSIPLAVAGYVFFLRSGLASTGTAFVAAALGLPYQFLSNALHTARSRRSAPSLRA